jgi:hypothetical protein
MVTGENDPVCFLSKTADKGKIRHHPSPVTGTPPLTWAFAVTHRRGVPRCRHRAVHIVGAQLTAGAERAGVALRPRSEDVATAGNAPSTTRPALPSGWGRGVEKFPIEPPETRQSPPDFSPYAFPGLLGAAHRPSSWTSGRRRPATTEGAARG